MYDNGCHLLAYGLNRFASFWTRARVLVDCLHYRGHCACSKCFDASVYQFKDFNSQACEQVNAFLKRSAPSFHQMTSRLSNGVDVLQQCSVERTQATINVHQVSLIQRPGNGTKKTWARGAAYINLRRASLLSASWERHKSPWARAHEPRLPPPKMS